MTDVADVWEESVGSIPYKVVVFEALTRKRVLYLKWRRAGNWKYESLNNAAIDAGFLRGNLYDKNGERLTGRALAKMQAWAKDQAESKWAKLKAGLPDREQKLASPLTLGETWPILIEPDTGLYPTKTQHRDEVARSLNDAKRILGSDMPWAGIQSEHLVKLARTRIRELQKKGDAGLRSAEIIIARMVAIATWLRDAKKIPADACVVPSNWKTKLREDWQTVTKSDRLPAPSRPRHTREDVMKLLDASWSADPRLGLLLALGAELRGGQVVRGKRSDLDLEKNRHKVYGSGKKKGTVINLTKGQRAAVDRALHPDTGYLRELEAAYQAKSIADYLFFPGGMFHGIKVLQRGYASNSKDPYYVPPLHPAIPVDGNDKRKPASGTAIRNWFRLAEKRAGIPYEKGRALYGPRRAGVDGAKSLKISREALQEWGGWADSQVPDQIYADEEREYARDEAAGARAKFRGEEE